MLNYPVTYKYFLLKWITIRSVETRGKKSCSWAGVLDHSHTVRHGFVDVAQSAEQSARSAGTFSTFCPCGKFILRIAAEASLYGRAPAKFGLKLTA